MPEHRSVVAAGDAPDGLPGVAEDRPLPRGLPAFGGEAAESALEPAFALGLERTASPEVLLLPADHPVEPGLQRGDARSELVPVEREPGLEPQRVPCAESGRFDPSVHERPPEGGCDLVRDRALDSVFARVARSGGDACRSLPGEGRDPEPPDGGRLGNHRRKTGPGLRALHREHTTRRGGVPTADRLTDAAGVRGVGHDVEGLLLEPPDDQVVEDRPVAVVEEVGVLGTPRLDLAEVVGECFLEQPERPRALDAHGSEVADVEDHRVLAAATVLGEGAVGVRERHLPASELDELRAELAVRLDEGSVTGCSVLRCFGRAAPGGRGVAHAERIPTGRLRRNGGCRAAGVRLQPARTSRGARGCPAGRAR